MIRFHIPILLLLATAAPLCLAWRSSEASARVTERTGRITGWKVDADGSVFLRLEGEGASRKPFRLWFVTPPSRTSTTEFERIALQVVLEMSRAAGGPNAPQVTVRGDTSNDLGKSIDDAMELVSIARM